MSSRRALVARYVLADLFSGALAWTLFYMFRKMVYMEPAKFGYEVPLAFDDNYWYGLVLIPLFWVGLYTMPSAAIETSRRYRIKELGQTVLISLIGVIVIFFVLFLDDTVANYRYYYRSFLVPCSVCTSRSPSPCASS
jgi:hypothetical protein